MKKYLFIITLSFFAVAINTSAQVHVTSDGWLQVDYTSGGQALSFGNNAGAGYPEWGQFGIEHFNGGLNFWIPWPNPAQNGGNYRLFIQDNTGFVGINDGTPSYTLDVNGDIATGGTIRLSSDKRLKTDIKQLSGAMDKLLKLQGVSYTMKKFRKNNTDVEMDSIKNLSKRKTLENEAALSEDSIPQSTRLGFIAQDLKEVFPELVDEDNDGYLNIDYIGLIPVLVNAIKELEGRMEDIENNCCNNASLKSASIENGNGLESDGTVAKLYQNAPNPFSTQTIIKFEIPETVGNAQLYICNMTGTLLKNIAINQRGAGNVTISGNELNAGMYLYSLVDDGKIVDTKQMLLTD